MNVNIAKFIDHTLLSPTTTASDIERLCQEAKEHGFYAVCVPPYYVSQAVNHVNGSTVKVATVAGFPLGYATTIAKVEEIKRAIEEGASEVDVVINLAAVKSGNWIHVQSDLDRMTTTARLKNKVIKVILETALLTADEIIRLCAMCNDQSVDFAKTSTGFNGGGASLEAVQLMREHLKDSIRIKASGGIRDRYTAEQFIRAGADRIGTSSGILIVRG